MKNICLNFTSNSNKIKFKLASIKTMNNNKFLTFTPRKQVNIPSDTCIIEIESNNELNAVYQLEINISKLVNFYKDGKKYLQQEYVLSHNKIILRYNSQLLLVEIVYKL